MSDWHADRVKLREKIETLKAEKKAIEKPAFERWDAGMNGLTPDQARKRYLNERIFTVEEQTKLNKIELGIKNCWKLLQDFPEEKSDEDTQFESDWKKHLKLH